MKIIKETEKKFLFYVSFISIAFLLFIRFYANVFETPVRTWDDRYYRSVAVNEAQNSSALEVIKKVILPNDQNYFGERSRGYHSWLVLFVKIFPSVDYERSLLWLNYFFLLVQLGLILAFAHWAFKDANYALAFTFIYVSTPIIHGMSGWIMTENLVLLSLSLFTYCAVNLVYDEKDKNLLKPLGIGFLFGIFSTTREYVMPTLFAIIFVVTLSMWRRRRFLFLGAYLFVFGFYAAAMASWLPPILERIGEKSKLEIYSYPLGKWLSTSFFLNVGPAAIILIIIAIPYLALLIRRVVRSRGVKVLKSTPSLFLFSNISLAILYAAVIVLSTNRTVRSCIPLIFALFSIILFSVKLAGSSGFKVNHNVVTATFTVLIAVSWMFNIYQLFYSYNGGKGFAVHPYNPKYEVYNHPLRLPLLKDSTDMHVSPKWAKDIPYWKLTRDIPEDIERVD